MPSKSLVMALCLAPLCATAQQDGSTFESVDRATSSHYDCVLAQAKRMAKIKESPSDIAEVALQLCLKDEVEVRKEFSKPLAGTRMTHEHVQTLVESTLTKARRAAIAVVFGVRYPNL